jgi:hypothetical protein
MAHFTKIWKWKLLFMNGCECKSWISTAKGNLNQCQDWSNARECSGVRLTNSDNSMERKLTTQTVVKICRLIVTKWGTSDQVQ